MTKLRLRTALAVATSFTASAAFVQMIPTPQTSPQTAGAIQTVPQDRPATSSSDPLIQKYIDDKAASDEYKAHKIDTKAAYKEKKKIAKANRKAEKKEARAKCEEAMSEQGGPTQAPDNGGK